MVFPPGFIKECALAFGRLARSLATCFCFAQVRILAERFISWDAISYETRRRFPLLSIGGKLKELRILKGLTGRAG